MNKAQKYSSREFKQEAVQLLQTSGATQAEVARNLGAAKSSLYRWINELTEYGKEAFPGSGHQHKAGCTWHCACSRMGHGSDP